MKYLLIQDIDPEFYQLLEERARLNGRSLAEEVEWLMREGLASPHSKIKMGTWMFNLVLPNIASIWISNTMLQNRRLLISTDTLVESANWDVQCPSA
jgi:hypothetical protein